MDENAVIAVLCTHLREFGYEIIQELTTTEKGIDIKAKHPQKPGYLLIEAKGGTSSRGGSQRHGKPFNSNQIFNRVAKGFYTAGSLCSKSGENGDEVALAFPDLPQFREYLSRVKPGSREITLSPVVPRSGPR